MEIPYRILLTVGGFLLGGVMFSQSIPKLRTGKDVCAISVDGNPGAFNAFKHCGKKIGALCLFLDILKGFLPVFIASLLLSPRDITFAFVMFAPVLGHATGIFNRFRGGKCISVSFGVTIGLLPVTAVPFTTLAGLYILLSTVLKIKNAAKRSVAVYALFAVISCTVLCITGLIYIAIGCAMTAALPIIKFLFSENGLADNRLRDTARAGGDGEVSEKLPNI